MSNLTLTPTSTQSKPTSSTPSDWGLFLLRLALGIVFMAHGSQKLFGAFGGPGLAGVVKMMGSLGYLVSIGEFFGGLGIVVGFLTRFSAGSLIVIMLGAIAMVHIHNGFFMNWMGSQKGEGIEYHLLVIGMCLAILIGGPGHFVLSRLLPVPKHPVTGQPHPSIE